MDSLYRVVLKHPSWKDLVVAVVLAADLRQAEQLALNAMAGEQGNYVDSRLLEVKEVKSLPGRVVLYSV